MRSHSRSQPLAYEAWTRHMLMGWCAMVTRTQAPAAKAEEPAPKAEAPKAGRREKKSASGFGFGFGLGGGSKVRSSPAKHASPRALQPAWYGREATGGSARFRGLRTGTVALTHEAMVRHVRGMLQEAGLSVEQESWKGAALIFQPTFKPRH